MQTQAAFSGHVRARDATARALARDTKGPRLRPGPRHGSSMSPRPTRAHSIHLKNEGRQLA
eukprot:12037364-Heterocapsa_arctica.AAC.1